MSNSRESGWSKSVADDLKDKLFIETEIITALAAGIISSEQAELIKINISSFADGTLTSNETFVFLKGCLEKKLYSVIWEFYRFDSFTNMCSTRYTIPVVNYFLATLLDFRMHKFAYEMWKENIDLRRKVLAPLLDLDKDIYTIVSSYPSQEIFLFLRFIQLGFSQSYIAELSSMGFIKKWYTDLDFNESKFELIRCLRIMPPYLFNDVMNPDRFACAYLRSCSPLELTNIFNQMHPGPVSLIDIQQKLAVKPTNAPHKRKATTEPDSGREPQDALFKEVNRITAAIKRNDYVYSNYLQKLMIELILKGRFALFVNFLNIPPILNFIKQDQSELTIHLFERCHHYSLVDACMFLYQENAFVRSRVEREPHRALILFHFLNSAGSHSPVMLSLSENDTVKKWYSDACFADDKLILFKNLLCFPELAARVTQQPSFVIFHLQSLGVADARSFLQAQYPTASPTDYQWLLDKAFPSVSNNPSSLFASENTDASNSVAQAEKDVSLVTTDVNDEDLDELLRYLTPSPKQ